MDQNIHNGVVNRKRVGRPPKNSGDPGSSTPRRSLVLQSTSITDDLNVPSSLPIASLTSKDAINEACIERRRSSRKKVIKFDVRDLLNKNRRTHKIQIEARIDSNAPTSVKDSSNSEYLDGYSSTSTMKNQVTPEEMFVKKQTFMEKSAIFRRYSISAEQPKQPLQLPLPPVPLLNSVAEIEKKKPTSPLILAQMENSTHMVNSKYEKRKQLRKPTKNLSNDIPQQKRRGRPPKNKITATTSSTEICNYVNSPIQTLDENHVNSKCVNHLPPKNPSNWKEYKAAVNQSSVLSPCIATPDDSKNKVELSSSPVLNISPSLDEDVTSDSQLIIKLDTDEPDITSSPYEEVIIETTASPQTLPNNSIHNNNEFCYDNENATNTDCGNHSKIPEYKSDVILSNEEQIISLTAPCNTISSKDQTTTNSSVNALTLCDSFNNLQCDSKLTPLTYCSTRAYHIKPTKCIYTGGTKALNLDTSCTIQNNATFPTEIAINSKQYFHSIKASATDESVVEISEIPRRDTVVKVIKSTELFENPLNDFNTGDEQQLNQGLDRQLLKTDESSQKSCMPTKNMYREINHDSKMCLQINEELNKKNQTEDVYEYIIENEFEQTSHEDKFIVVTDIDQSENSPVNVISFEMANQSNALESYDTSFNNQKSVNIPTDTNEYLNPPNDTKEQILDIDNVKNKEESHKMESFESIAEAEKILKKSNCINLDKSKHNDTTKAKYDDKMIKEHVLMKVNMENISNLRLPYEEEATLSKTVQIIEESQSNGTISESVHVKNMNDVFNGSAHTKTSSKTDSSVTSIDQTQFSDSNFREMAIESEQSQYDYLITTEPCTDYNDEGLKCSNIHEAFHNVTTDVIVNTVSETQLDKNLVQQVNIETGTLLDILRQVKTNNEAREVSLNKNSEVTDCINEIKMTNELLTTTSNSINCSTSMEPKSDTNCFIDDAALKESVEDNQRWKRIDQTYCFVTDVGTKSNSNNVLLCEENSEKIYNELENDSCNKIGRLTSSNIINKFTTIEEEIVGDVEENTTYAQVKSSKEDKKSFVKRTANPEESTSKLQGKVLSNDMKKEKKYKSKNKHQVNSKEKVRVENSNTNNAQPEGDSKQKPTEMEELQKENNEAVTAEIQISNVSSFKKIVVEEKVAKKKRHGKLKEAFEAALSDTSNNKDFSLISSPCTNVEEGNSNILPICKSEETFINKALNETINVSNVCKNVQSSSVEEDSDPLKDIEKFIEDGVNLLKKDYKIDQGGIDVVICAKTTEQVNDNDDKGDAVQVEANTSETRVKVIKEKDDQGPNESKGDSFPKEIVNTFETPADTPIATPSATPPPKSPYIDDINLNTCNVLDFEENCGVRRSHRIKQITKAPKAKVGRGLVRDRERFSIKDDVEMKSHYSLDDHLIDLAQVEAKNAKFLKDMEERLSNFQVIKENEYKCERVISREAKKMICDCFLTTEEEERGELGCGEDCLNRLLMIECGPDCNVKERCTNKRFQKYLCSPCRVFRTEKKGFGIMTDIEIHQGEFIMEYVGEVIDSDEFECRRVMYSREKNRHYYFMALRSDAIIDATIKGNISRFINHSCDPNAETQKWTVNGELRIGFFSRKSIMPGEEITFDYQYQRYGREAQRCYCESANCRGWIGQEPNSDEGEQVSDECDFEEDDEEEDSPNLLVDEDDDEDDSDDSVPDPEEVQKKLEMAAAEAEAELAPIALDEAKMKELQKSKKGDLTKSQTEINLEDSKCKFKNLLNKMAEKVAAKQKQNKRELKLQRKQRTKKKRNELPLANKQRSLEDPDIEDEVEFLKRCGVKNQSDTLRLSRLMVRAKLVQTRLNLLEILRKGELPCRRLFLDYHGLRLVHGWMSEDGGNMQIRLALLQTLETLPIANKTILTDTKVLQVVRNWCSSSIELPLNDSTKEPCSSTLKYLDNTGNTVEPNNLCNSELQKLASKLISTWDGLPEIFRIPKKERIEQMKEHEREADRQYAASAQNDSDNNIISSDLYRRDRFGRGIPSSYNRFAKPHNIKTIIGLSSVNRINDENMKHLTKTQRRKMFAAKVAREEADKRLAEERREIEIKCRFFGLDPKITRPQDIPFCVNQFTGQWYSVDRKPIVTPPIYSHVQLPVKPKSTDPADYQLPAVVATLPPQWKYTITSQGKIYYYHVKYRIPQWDPPTLAQLKHCESEANDGDSENEMSHANDSSDDEDDILIGMDAAQLKSYIEKKVQERRQKRYQRLVDERAISPRREEDRIYNQMEVRKYKENKEKIRKRKEGIRRRRAEALRQSNNQSVLTVTDVACNVQQKLPNKPNDADETITNVLPIQDYLLSSDEEDDIKAECNNSPLIDKIVEGDKIVDELDALTTKRPLKRVLPCHRNSSEASASTTVSTNSSAEKQEIKKRKIDKKEKRRNKDADAKYRKLKEKFRCEIAGIIVHHLKPYRKDTCTVGRIQSNEDFNHLARKLTHFVMIKELKYCESVGQTLIVTESVKNKSREFIKKYMAKYGVIYVKPNNDPEFKEVPYTL